MNKYFEEITEDGQDVFSWEKPYINFISRKYYAQALNHEVYNEVYSHQLFSILINFTHIFCHWHKQKTSKVFLRKSCSEVKDFGKFPWAHSRWMTTFIKLYVDRQHIYKNCTSARMFPAIFKKTFLHQSSNHHEGYAKK